MAPRLVWSNRPRSLFFCCQPFQAPLSGTTSIRDFFSAGDHLCSRKCLARDACLPGNHLSSQECLVRDVFQQRKASLLREISDQGLFFSGTSIFFWWYILSGIIFSALKHPHLQEFSARDYSATSKSISVRRNRLSGIIFGVKKHLYAQECLIRDDLVMKKSSPKAPKSI